MIGLLVNKNSWW
jgi:hypothetical protein